MRQVVNTTLELPTPLLCRWQGQTKSTPVVLKTFTSHNGPLGIPLVV